MTMVSFRIDDKQATALREWAERLGVDRSSLLRDAVHRHLVFLRASQDVAAYAMKPVTPEESSFDKIADWGPAEDWSDWHDAEG